VSLLFFVCFRVEPPRKETAQKRLLCTEITVVPFRFYLQRLRVVQVCVSYSLVSLRDYEFNEYALNIV
jgi:hypothetical protein